MKCLTMEVDRKFVSSYGMAPGMIYISNHNPSQPIQGIVVRADERKLIFDGHVVNVSHDLIRVGLGNGDVVFENYQLRIFRASVRLGSDGYFELVPERENDKKGALVFFDVGSGMHATVDYEIEGFGTVASRIVNSLPFVGYETVMLAMLNPGQRVHARRYTKRYFMFGERELRQTLTYQFDGENLALVANQK